MNDIIRSNNFKLKKCISNEQLSSWKMLSYITTK